ncbi:hypothetical protein DSUL_100031 [Desulfovibrionales bacterium]
MLLFYYSAECKYKQLKKMYKANQSNYFQKDLTLHLGNQELRLTKYTWTIAAKYIIYATVRTLISQQRSMGSPVVG